MISSVSLGVDIVVCEEDAHTIKGVIHVICCGLMSFVVVLGS